MKFVAILAVQVEADGRLRPCWYGVREVADWEQMTVVDSGHTIALCTLLSQTIEDACNEFFANLSWFKPLLQGAEPEAWFVEQTYVERNRLA